MMKRIDWILSAGFTDHLKSFPPGICRFLGVLLAQAQRMQKCQVGSI